MIDEEFPPPTPKEEYENDIRCVASDIIIKLYEAKNITQLEILQMQVNRSLEYLRSPE